MNLSFKQEPAFGKCNNGAEMLMFTVVWAKRLPQGSQMVIALPGGSLHL